MVGYTLYFTKQAGKDAKKLKQSGLRSKAEKILEHLAKDPYDHSTHSYEKLVGDLQGLYSIRINIQHRLVYQILESKKAIKIIRMWTHYE
jgi:Txe/YoeB family toxin of toxin-antitoxin system